MITDERITELWNLASNTATSKPDWTYSEIIFATVRAVIAEHDAELRKQEPVAWIHPLYKESGFKLVGITRWSDDCLPLYAAPIPPEPTPSQQEALRICDGFRVLAGQTNDADKLKHFILARPDEVTK